MVFPSKFLRSVVWTARVASEHHQRAEETLVRRSAQVACGIYGATVFVDLEVDVRTGRSATITHQGNDVASANHIADFDKVFLIYAPAGEKAVDMTEKKEEVYEATEETTEEVTEEFEAEEEVNETEVEEQFAAEQKAEEAEETVEDKTVNFNGITADKVSMVNSFFNKFN